MSYICHCYGLTIPNYTYCLENAMEGVFPILDSQREVKLATRSLEGKNFPGTWLSIQHGIPSSLEVFSFSFFLLLFKKGYDAKRYYLIYIVEKYRNK